MADLYLPEAGRRYPGILLNHGVVDTGKNDPRLRRFAEILCRSGFVVCVPDFKGMQSFRIAPSDIDEVQAAFENLISLGKFALPESCGLFGFSYGSGPTIIAASRPVIGEKVRFIVSFGGYYDLKNVLSYLATGNFEFEGKRYFRKPQEYGKWVFLENNLDLVTSAQDRLILQRILEIKLKDEQASIEQFLPLLGEEGKNALALLSHSDPKQTEMLLQKLPSNIRSSIEALSVAPALKQVKADLILAHGEDDDMIPYTETLRLAQAAPDPRRVYLQILKSYAHVDPDRQPLTMKNFFTFHLPEAWKLFGLINQLMKYRQAN
jgi:dienelactone hydrolase